MRRKELMRLNAAVVFICVLVQFTQGFVKRSEWDVEEYIDGIRPCNLPKVTFRTTQISKKLTVANRLEPKEYKTKLQLPELSHDARWESLSRFSQVIFVGTAIYYFDGCLKWSDDGSTCAKFYPDGRHQIFKLDMSEQAKLLFKSDYSREGPALCDFDMSNATPVGNGIGNEECFIFRSFQMTFEESRSLVTYDSIDPTQLTTSPDSKYIAWIENVDTKSVLRVFNLDKNYALSDDSLNSYEVIDRTSSALPTEDEYGPASFHVQRSKPVFCGEDFLLYEVSSGNTSAIVLRSLNNNLNVETVGTKSFFPVAALVSEKMKSRFGDLYVCTAAWIESDSFSITIFQLPRRETRLITKSEWSLDSFTEIFDMSLTGDHLFLVVYSPTLKLYKIRYTNVEYEYDSLAALSETAEFLDVEDTESSGQLKFHTSTSNSIVLYTKRGEAEDGSDNQLRMLQFRNETFGSLAGNMRKVHCLVESKELRPTSDSRTETKHIVDASVFHDSIVWIAEYHDDNTMVLELLDLDKDNDDTLDIIDEFPFNFNFRNDFDQDGVADEMDFISYDGIPDDIVMYTLFFTFYSVVIIMAVGAYKYYRFLERKRQEYLQQLQDDDPEDDMSKSKASQGIGSILFKKILQPDGDDDDGNQNVLVKNRSMKLKGKIVPADMHGRAAPAITRKLTSDGPSKGGGLSVIIGSKLGDDANNNSLKDYSRTTRYDAPIRFILRANTLSEIVLTSLTVSSLILAVYPSFPYGGVQPKVQRMCIWADFFSFSLFALDLFGRYFTRNKKEYPTVRSFLKDNWYDIPALLTDVPMTFIQFPDLLGLFKGFRIIRLYRRFTQQAIFVSMMVRRPMFYLATVISLIIIICSVFIKIIEQEEQEKFRDFTNVLWFSVVTVTTVGYGDLTVKQPETWIMTIFLMLMGIGLISTISAFCAERIVSIGKTDETKKELRTNLKNRAELLKIGLMHIAEPYNPLSVALESIVNQGERSRRPRSGIRTNLEDPFAKRTSEEPAKKHLQWVERNYEVVNKHKSSTLNVTMGMKSELTLPIEKVLEGAGGKFRIGAITSQADLIRAVAKEYERGMLLQVLRLQKNILSSQSQEAASMLLENGMDGTFGSKRDVLVDKFSSFDFSPQTRLHFVLLRFSLHKPEKGGVSNFTEMAEELADIIFEPTRPLGVFVEKIFSIDHEWKNAKKTSTEKPSSVAPFYSFDFQDPLHEKYVRIDDHFERYGISERVDYNELMTELMILVLLHDRVTTLTWALKNLCYKKDTQRPKPVYEELEPPAAEMTKSNVVIVNSSQPNEAELVIEAEQEKKRAAGWSKPSRRASIIRSKSRYSLEE